MVNVTVLGLGVGMFEMLSTLPVRCRDSSPAGPIVGKKTLTTLLPRTAIRLQTRLRPPNQYAHSSDGRRALKSCLMALMRNWNVFFLPIYHIYCLYSEGDVVTVPQ